MAEITRTRSRGDEVEYRVDWEDNDGVGRERCFRSFRAAERYAFKIEFDLLNETLQEINGTVAAPPPEGVHRFNAMVRSKRRKNDPNV